MGNSSDKTKVSMPFIRTYFHLTEKERRSLQFFSFHDLNWPYITVGRDYMIKKKRRIKRTLFFLIFLLAIISL